MPIRLGPSYDRVSSASSLSLGIACLACRSRGRQMCLCCVEMGRAVRRERCACSEFRGIGIDKHGNLGPRFPMLPFRFPSGIRPAELYDTNARAKLGSQYRYPRTTPQLEITMTVSSPLKFEVPRHRLRNGLASNTPQFGCFSSLSSSWTARIVASCGWDVSHILR